MNIKTKLRILSIILIGTTILSCGSQVKNNAKKKLGQTNDAVALDKNIKVLIKTTAGNMVALLYDGTPLHKANFLKLVKEKYYDGVLFHRVIKDFMIQTGDPNSKNAAPNQMLGEGGPGYTVEAEFNPKFIHKKGALAAARQGDNVNPEKKSSGSQFYIVQGKKYGKEEMLQMQKNMESQSFAKYIREYLAQNKTDLQRLQKMESEKNAKGFTMLLDSITNVVKSQHPEIKFTKYTPEQLDVYATLGGTPFLDRNYTVFGEIVEGLDVIDKIAAMETNAQDRPNEDVKIISMKVVDN